MRHWTVEGYLATLQQEEEITTNKITFNNNGLSGIFVNGNNILNVVAAPAINALSWRAGTDNTLLNERIPAHVIYPAISLDKVLMSTTFDADTKIKTWKYGSLTTGVVLSYEYNVVSNPAIAPAAYQLDIIITITNNSPNYLVAFGIGAFSVLVPLDASLPAAGEATYFGGMTAINDLNNFTGPLALPLVTNNFNLMFCSDETAPLKLKWNAGTISGNTQGYGAQVFFGDDTQLYDGIFNDREIAPNGGAISSKVSLRFLETSTRLTGGLSLPQLAGDILSSFAVNRPMTLNWPDRRPIIRVFIGDMYSATNGIESGNRSEWSYVNGSAPPVPVDPGLIAKWKNTMMLDQASRLTGIHNVKDSVQGIVIWNIEGNSAFISLYDGALYAGCSTHTLTIQNIPNALMNGYVYRASVTNTAATKYSAGATLTISTDLSLPVVTTHPSNVTIDGDTTVFSAVATGNPFPVIQWQINRGGGWGDLAGIPAVRTPDIRNMQVSWFTGANSGEQYRAKFMNAALLPQRIPSTGIQPAPKATVTLVKLDISTTKTITTSLLTINGVAYVPQWQVAMDAANHNWTDITPNSMYSITTTDTTTTLVITGITSDMVVNASLPAPQISPATAPWTYRCVFKDTAVYSNPATLTVMNELAPVIWIQPISQTIAKGEIVSFTANTSETSDCSVRWQCNDGSGWRTITNSDDPCSILPITTGFQYWGCTTNVLTIYNTTLSITGYQYRAVYTNNTGTTATYAATLTVLASTPTTAAAIVTNPTSVSTAVGDTVTFTVETSGFPVGAVQWQVSTNVGVATKTWTNITDTGGGAWVAEWFKFVGEPKKTERYGVAANLFADEYFKRFRDLGLAVGICLRPTMVRPYKAANGRILIGQDEEYNKTFVEILSEKIDYALARWGATIYYVDSNSVLETKTENGHILTALSSAEEWDELAIKYSNVWNPHTQSYTNILFLPEHAYYNCYTSSASYDQMDNLAGGYARRTSPLVKYTWPEACKCLFIDQNDGISIRQHGSIIEAVQTGDILMSNTPLEVGGIWMDSYMKDGAGVLSAISDADKEVLGIDSPTISINALDKLIAASTRTDQYFYETLKTLAQSTEWSVAKSAIGVIGNLMSQGYFVDSSSVNTIVDMFMSNLTAAVNVTSTVITIVSGDVGTTKIISVTLPAGITYSVPRWQMAMPTTTSPFTAIWREVVDSRIYSGAGTLSLSIVVTTDMVGNRYRCLQTINHQQNYSILQAFTAIGSIAVPRLGPSLVQTKVGSVTTTQTQAAHALCAIPVLVYGTETTLVTADAGITKSITTIKYNYTPRWQVATSSSSTIWTNLSDDSMYSGSTTNTLTITGITSPMATVGYRYRCVLTNNTDPIYNPFVPLNTQIANPVNYSGYRNNVLIGSIACRKDQATIDYYISILTTTDPNLLSIRTSALLQLVGSVGTYDIYYAMAGNNHPERETRSYNTVGGALLHYGNQQIYNALVAARDAELAKAPADQVAAYLTRLQGYVGVGGLNPDGTPNTTSGTYIV